MTSVEPAPLVGRVAELARLRSLLGRPAPGQPGAAIVSGDAGIGKTRLLREFGRAAAAAGALVLVGHCVSFGGDTVPFLPISEAFGRLDRDESATVDKLRDRFPPLARLLPQRRLVGSEGEIGRLDPADLYEAVLGALMELSAERAVVLVVEDLHWADGATRDLFGFLLARLADESSGAIALVASYRSDDLHRRHPLRSVVLEWGRLPGVMRLPLEPLGRAEVATLLKGLAADPIDEEALADVLDRAQGNAFFAEQLLVEVTGAKSSAAGIPRDLADLLLVRLERLSAESRQVLQVIAVAGQQIQHDLLARVANLDDARLDAALREATDAHVLDRTHPDGNGYTFRHALLAEAVYDDLLPGERRRHHAQFAEVIASQELPGTDADLARHAREAADLPTAFQAGIRAGDEAMRVAAPGEAMRLYEAAQQLAPMVPDPRTVMELPRKAANAASHAGHPFRAVHLLEEALERLPADAAPDVRATLMVELAEHAFAIDTGYDLIDLTRRALALVPVEPPSALRARTLAAVARALSGYPALADEAIDFTEQARAVAVLVDTPDVEAEAATTRARLERWRADPLAAERLLTDSVARARDSGDLRTQLRSLFNLGGARYERGALEEALSAYSEVAALARESGRPWQPYGADALIMLVQVDYAAGHWDDALGTAEAYANAPALARAGLAAAALAVHAGRGAGDILRRAELSRPWWKRDGLIAIFGGSALIDACGQNGDLVGALAVHDEVVSSVSALWSNPWFDARIRLHTLALAALAGAVARVDSVAREAAVQRGWQLIRDARKVVEVSRGRRGDLGPESAAWAARAEAEWVRLRWAAALDTPAPIRVKPTTPDTAPATTDTASMTADTAPATTADTASMTADAAPAARETASAAREAAPVKEALAADEEGAAPTAEQLVTAWRAATDGFDYGHRFESARSRARLAMALQASGDGAGAQREAQVARAVARELQAAPLLAELEPLVSARPVSERREQDLTPREQQVLELLALGRTNRQIGKALFISDKTVSVHVSNLMAKLGAGGRTEAAALARRAGLLEGAPD